jgi:hypothetical protein
MAYMHEDKCYKKNMQQDKILWMGGSYNEHTCNASLQHYKRTTCKILWMDHIRDGLGPKCMGYAFGPQSLKVGYCHQIAQMSLLLAVVAISTI